MTRAAEMIREGSTWRGLGIIFSLAGISAGPELAGLAGQIALAALGIWELLRRTYGKAAG